MPPTPNKPGAPTERLSPRELWGFAVGGLPYGMGVNAPKQLASSVFNIILGVNPVWIGTMLMIARIFDAVLDPIMGTITDNARTRWGRRKPFILAGSILCAVTFPLIWCVPRDLTPTLTMAWFCVTLLLFYFCYTLFCVPYLALQIEMTPDYHERTRVNAMRSLCGAVAGVTAVWALRGAQWGGFPDIYVGLRVMGVALGLCFLLGLFALFARERYRHLAAKQAKQNLLNSFRSTFGNVPFRLLMGLTLVFILGTYTVQIFSVYVNTYYVCGGSLAKATTLSGLYSSVNLVAVFALIPPLTAAAKRWGKERTLMGCLVVGSVGAIGKWFLFDPRWPYAQLALPFLLAPVETGFWILLQSMKADVVDWDEHTSGVRREGAYAAISSWMQKFSVALTNSLGGILLVMVGFDQARGVEQPAGTITSMRLLFSAGPLVAFAVGLFLLRRYPLTQERMRKVRTDLEQRRAPV